MKRYIVQQGLISKSGCGDMFEDSSFDNIKEAIAKANDIKNSTNGWVGKGDLITEVYDCDTDSLIERFICVR